MDRLRDEATWADDVAPEDVGIERPMPPTIQDVIAARLGRRELLRGLAAATVAAAWPAGRAGRAEAQGPAFPAPQNATGR
jgi:hypothetical protein